MDGHFQDLLFYFSFHDSTSDQYFSLCSYPHPHSNLNMLMSFIKFLSLSWSGGFLLSEIELINLFLLWCIVNLIFSRQWFLRSTLLRSTLCIHYILEEAFSFVTLTVTISCNSWDIPVLAESGVSRKMTNKSLQEIWKCWLVK